MKQKRTFYRVVPNPSFSQIDTATLKEARAKKKEFGECKSPDATPENKAYWAKQGKLCKIVKVIEITEEVQ